MSELLPGFGFKQKYTQSRAESKHFRFLMCCLLAAGICSTFGLDAMADEGDHDSEEEEPELQIVYHHGTLSGFFEDFDTREDDDQSELEIELAYPFQLSPSVAFYLNTSAVYERNRGPGDTRWKNQDYVDLNELWLQWQPDMNPMTKIRVGRQSIADQNGWWWDEEFDAIHYSHHNPNSGFSLGLAKLAETEIGLDQDDPEDDDLYWLMLRLVYQNSRFGSIGGYVTRLDDRSSTFVPDQLITSAEIDEADATLNWVGLRYKNTWNAEPLGKMTVSFDLAYLKGRETIIEVDDESEDEPPIVEELQRVHLQGRASHVEFQWQPRFDDKLSFGLLYAEGSTEFRQTGVHSNETDHHYYGSLFDPSLQNTQIAGLHASREIADDGKLILQYLEFSRPNIEKDPGENEIDLEVDTENRDLGTEIGLKYAQELFDDFELEVSVARFKAGKAYGEFNDKTFNRLEVELSYSF